MITTVNKRLTSQQVVENEWVKIEFDDQTRVHFEQIKKYKGLLNIYRNLKF